MNTRYTGLVASTTRPRIPDAVETGEATTLVPANHVKRAVRLQYDCLCIHEGGQSSGADSRPDLILCNACLAKGGRQEFAAV